MNTKIFADGADVGRIRELAPLPHIAGFTTNPTLMRASGVQDYRAFAQEVLALIGDRPISFEVLADDLPTMARQAREIASWSPQVYVKIPITDTAGGSTAPLVRELTLDGVQVNVTAVLTLEQVDSVLHALEGGARSTISIFAGRIADTGRDPIPTMREAVRLSASQPQVEVLWASPREILNLVQANEIGCHIITMTPDLLAKIPTLGKDLALFSQETVQMFFRDAKAAGFVL